MVNFSLDKNNTTLMDRGTSAGIMTLFLGVFLGLILCQHPGHATETLNDFEEANTRYENMEVKTNKPIIGILCQEVDGKHLALGSGQYMTASYVKMVESAGGRVAPIFIDRTPEEIEKLFYSINGVIFPGGHVKLNDSRYATVGKQFFDLALKSNREGKVFPIWAECLGLEMVSLIASGYGFANGQYDERLLTFNDAKNFSTTLKFHDFSTSTFYRNTPRKFIPYMENTPFAYNNHGKGISPQTYQRLNGLNSMFRITTTSFDRTGIEFISTLEGRRYPFFLLHWHPSKSQFEWARVLNIFHSSQAVAISQSLINGFINLATLNDHKFASIQEEDDALIYKYTTTYTEPLGTAMQMYFFKYNPN